MARIRSSSSSSSELVGGKKVGDQVGRDKKPVTGEAPKKKADLKEVHQKSTSPSPATDPVVNVAEMLTGRPATEKKRKKESDGQSSPAPETKRKKEPQGRRNSDEEKVVSSASDSSESKRVSQGPGAEDGANDVPSQPVAEGKPPGEGEPLHKTKKMGPPAPNYDPVPGHKPAKPKTNIDKAGAKLPPQAVNSPHIFASKETRELAGKYLTAMADLKEDRPANSKERGARSFAAGFVGYAPFALGSLVAGPFGKAALGGWAEPVAWTIMGTLDVFQGEIWLPLIHKDSVGSQSTSDFHEHFKARAGLSTKLLSNSDFTSAWLTMKKTDDAPFMMMPLSNLIPEIFAQPGYFKANPAAEYAIKQFGFAFLLSGLAVKTLADLRIAAHPESFVPEKTKEVLELQKAALKSLMGDMEKALGEIVDSTSSDSSEVVDDASSDSEDGGASMQRHVLTNMKDRVELQLKATELALKGKSAVLGHKLKTMFTPGHVDGARKTAMMVTSRCISLALGGLAGAGTGVALTAAGAPAIAVATVPPFVGQFFGYFLRQEYNAVLNYWSYYAGAITKGFPTKDDEPINPYDFNSPHLRQADALQGMPPPQAKAALDAQAAVVAKPPDSQIASTPTISATPTVTATTSTPTPTMASTASKPAVPVASSASVTAAHVTHRADMPDYLTKLQETKPGRLESDSSVPAVQRLLRHLATQVEDSKDPNDAFYPTITAAVVKTVMAGLTPDEGAKISQLERSELDYLGTDAASFVFGLAQQAVAS